MIKVKILRNKNGNIYEVDVNGHAEYDELGKDIVCAAVSGIVQTAVFGLIRVLGLQVDLTIEEGFLRFCIPNELLANGDNKACKYYSRYNGNRSWGNRKSYSDYIKPNIEGGVWYVKNEPTIIVRKRQAVQKRRIPLRAWCKRHDGQYFVGNN